MKKEKPRFIRGFLFEIYMVLLAMIPYNRQ